MDRIKLGFAFCGSFCTLKENIKVLRSLSKEEYDILPIVSFNVANLDTRFGEAKDIIAEIEAITNKKVIKTIQDAEPIGPMNLTDIMLVSPCTGNTLSKLAYSITDTPVTMAVKSHLRNCRPVVISVSTNDALSGSAKNIGLLSNLKNYYFVPLRQDNFYKKPTSLVANFDLIENTIITALSNVQIEPVVLPPL